MRGKQEGIASKESLFKEVGIPTFLIEKERNNYNSLP
jgi:hypothetical protein